ncbi:FAD binding domain-containing protein [Streptomyces acidicola]|uniref:FAD binding domain-containing protein n=1 Tax=Streptomyces acidicola TaxID=2596892 RepID=UPI00128BE532|nr:FAD-dependent monooxygenase [Streptomyces acidicola]
MTPVSDIKSAGVVGGSLGGLFQAVALAELGVDVTVWERSAGRPDDRGAGIVLQPSVAWFLSTFCGVDPDRISVPVTHRQFFSRDGRSHHTLMEQRMISWGAIYASLRDRLDSARYHDGQPVTAVTPRPGGVDVHVGDAVHRVDLAIIADGSASRHRGLVAPDGAPRYAGYVAYRGVIDETELPEGLSAVFRDRFSFYDGDRTQFLCYFIPGDFGATAPGSRRANWVWYVRADAAGLDRITTDRDGTAHGLSLPPGLIAPQVHAELLDRARTLLPEPLRLLVEHTRDPFAQAILDGRVSRMRKDRRLLTGDAAFVVRPHTAASAEKAAADAITLFTALQQLPSLEAALEAWERNRLAEGNALYRHGVGLGQRLGLNSPSSAAAAAGEATP